ncbi:SGNH/GDSL hydrolase family protein [Massilia forsythiae]|uniref:SGNH/GDSL hydrolase family protein n=1 Tax=Massilia forsythiae TaxID=2728020 RepID=A0A7Z2W232_9BURK|nr:SGNH/GDSL hydrolase family protein [Massilia forsythiae]QJE03052.1 SGNH/GDSL hydrolase family protein [Massilia forsythiae]
MIGPVLSSSAFQRYSGAGVNVVFDGNSLVAGFQASSQAKSTPSQMAALPPLSGAVSVTNIGVSGQTINQMRGRGSQYADGAYVAGKKNILLAWEGTNTVCNNGSAKTGLAAAADMASYVKERLAAHPDWVIVMMTTLPRFGIEAWSIPDGNAQLQAYDDYLRANWRAMGCKGLVDVRARGVFTYTGPTMSAVMSPYMAETIHCNDLGYGLIAQYCATGLRRLPVR